MSAKGRIVVFTGGPSTGKTTLIQHLSAAGYPVVREAATDVLRRAEAARVRQKRPQRFQEEILNLQLERESHALETAPAQVPIFADRGVGDHFGYLRHAGVAIFPGLEAAWTAALRRYAAILVLAPGPIYDPDGSRSESKQEAIAIHRLLGEEYRQRHPHVAEIPWGSPPEREQLVLAQVEQFVV